MLVSSTTSARAQPAAPAAQGSTDVPYPPRANGDAAVLIELVVEADGTVSSAVVLEGAEPFAEPARRAVLSWRFAPALRDHTPVAARIRARVLFHQAPRAKARLRAHRRRRQSPPVAATPASDATPESPLEVTVRGHRRDTGATVLSATDVREMPGAFGDPFRAIEALPGVTPILSGLPYFYIRGAPPNDNGNTIDDIRVPLLFHVGIGQGVIHPGSWITWTSFRPASGPLRGLRGRDHRRPDQRPDHRGQERRHRARRFRRAATRRSRPVTSR